MTAKQIFMKYPTPWQKAVHGDFFVIADNSGRVLLQASKVMADPDALNFIVRAINGFANVLQIMERDHH